MEKWEAWWIVPRNGVLMLVFFGSVPTVWLPLLLVKAFLGKVRRFFEKLDQEIQSWVGRQAKGKFLAEIMEKSKVG